MQKRGKLKLMILTMLWVSMKAEQVAEIVVRLLGGVTVEWMVARSSQSSARAGQDRQLVRQTAATERSNTARERAGRRGSDIRMLHTTNRFAFTVKYAKLSFYKTNVTLLTKY